MKRASLLIFPSLYEGFGLPPLEAMACGCPVVASNAASLPEVCGSAAYYIDPYRIESISDGMYRVLTNRRLRKYLIHKGFTRAKLYSWEVSASGHLSVIYHALNIPPLHNSQPTPQLIPVTEMQLY
jgi:glycosyltransferase involved in cell wall biosynthesis